MKPLGVGLVGLGRWGRNYTRTLSALPECRLVAAADASADARARAGPEFGTAARGALDDLLSDPAVEALVIATPDRTHFRLAAAALAAGRDVLVEKPMTLAVSEAETLAERAEAGSRVLAVGHTAVYAADLESLRVRLDAIPAGTPCRVSAERTSSGPPDRQSPIVYDLCPHDVALAVILLGTPVAARASSGRDRIEYEIRFAGDALLTGRAEWRKPPHTRRFEVKVKVKERGTTSLPPPLPLPGPGPRNSPLGRQCLDFIECCRTRRPPLSNGRLGVQVARCLAALTASCADGNAWVSFPSGR